MSKTVKLTNRERFKFFCDHPNESDLWLTEKLHISERTLFRYRAKWKILSNEKKAVSDTDNANDNKTFTSNLKSLNTEDIESELLRLYNEIDELTPKMKIMQHLLKIWEQKHKVPTKAKTETKFDFGKIKHGLS